MPQAEGCKLQADRRARLWQLRHLHLLSAVASWCLNSGTSQRSSNLQPPLRRMSAMRTSHKHATDAISIAVLARTLSAGKKAAAIFHSLPTGDATRRQKGVSEKRPALFVSARLVSKAAAAAGLGTNLRGARLGMENNGRRRRADKGISAPRRLRKWRAGVASQRQRLSLARRRRLAGGPPAGSASVGEPARERCLGGGLCSEGRSSCRGR